MSRYGHVRLGLLSLLFLPWADINSYSSLLSTYGSNFRRRTVLLADTFPDSLILTRELSPLRLTTKSSLFFLKLEHPNSHSYKISVYLSLSARNLCFRSCGKANSIEVRPILCSIRKIRFLCNFTGPPLENLLSCFSLFQIQT